MTDDIDTLSGPELSAAVATEVMGWERKECQSGYWYEDDGVPVQFDGGREWEPECDRNDAHLVLKRCEELGIETMDIEYHAIAQGARNDFWSLLTIDPTVICRAALRAARESR